MKKILTSLALVSSLALTGIAGIASAQTTGSVTPENPTYPTTDMASTTGTTGTTGSTGETNGSSTVGVPNTGAGGEAPLNYALLAISAAVAIGAAAFAFRKPKMR